MENDPTLTRLPSAEKAIVAPAKLRDYLLSATHPIGRFKAVFFGALGYTPDGWQLLREDLLQLARVGKASRVEANAYGQKYEVRGTLSGPAGRGANVVTVWIILNGETRPRFITAFPEE